MTEARIITAMPTLIVAGAVLVVTALLAVEAYRARRAEKAARPDGVDPAAAVRDAATTLHTRIQEQP